MNKTVEDRTDSATAQSGDCAPVDGLIAWRRTYETGSEVAREYCGIAGISIIINKDM